MSEGTRRAAEAVHRRAERVHHDHARPVERAVLRSLSPLICELFESSLQLKYLDDWRMTDEMRWYRATFGFDVGDELVLVEMHDHEWLAVGHFSAKDTPKLGGSTGVLGTAGGLSYAVTNPGGLLARYTFDESTGDPKDTAANPLGPFHLRLIEGLSGADPSGGAHSTWDGTQAPTYLVSAPPSGDPGGVQFNYNQLHIQAGNTQYPGSYFADLTTNPVVGPLHWGSTAGEVKSVGFFVKPSSAQALDQQPLVGYTQFNDTNNGLNGWWFAWKRSTGELSFNVVNGGGPPTRAFTLARSGLAADVWYRICATYEPVSKTWTLIINGVVVGTLVRDMAVYFPAVNGGIRVNGLQGWSGSFTDNSQSRGYGLFSINELDVYTVTLTPLDEGRIIAAAGPGYGTTITTLSIGAGASGSPGAISSGLATAGQKLTADGLGGTYWS